MAVHREFDVVAVCRRHQSYLVGAMHGFEEGHNPVHERYIVVEFEIEGILLGTKLRRISAKLARNLVENDRCRPAFQGVKVRVFEREVVVSVQRLERPFVQGFGIYHNPVEVEKEGLKGQGRQG